MQINCSESEYSLDVVLLGDSYVGKTCLINKYVHNRYREYPPSVQFDGFNKEVTFDDKLINLKIWDTVGTERFPKSIAVQYYRRADCCMLVYSVNNETSFQSLEFWKNEFMLHKGINNKSHFPFVVVGNKTDAYLQMSYEPVIKWCNKNGFKFYPTSAKEGTNVNDAFEGIAQLGYEFMTNDGKINRKNEKIRLESSIEETKKVIKKCSC